MAASAVRLDPRVKVASGSRDAGRRAGRDRVATEAPGADEVAVLAWPLLLKRKVTERVEASDNYPWLVLATVLFGLFSVGFTITILSNSVRRIADDLGSDVSTLTWVLTGPLLAFAVFGPAAGKLADLKGVRRVYLASLGAVAVFAALTAAGAVSRRADPVPRARGRCRRGDGPGIARHHQPALPPEPAGPGDGLLVDGRRRRTGRRRRRRRPDRPGLRVALDLHRPGAADARARCCSPPRSLPANTPARRGRRIDRVRRSGRGPPSASARRRCCSPSTAGRCGAGRTPPSSPASSSPPVSRRLHRRRAPGGAPVAAPRLPAPSQLLVPAAHPVLHELRLHGRVRHHPAAVAGRVRLRRDEDRDAAHRPTDRLRHRRSGRRLPDGAHRRAVRRPCSERPRSPRRWSALASLAPGDSDLVVVGALALSGLGMGASAPAMAAAIANSVDERDLGIAGATQQMVNQVGVVIGIQVMQTIQAARAELGRRRRRLRRRLPRRRRRRRARRRVRHLRADRHRSPPATHAGSRAALDSPPSQGTQRRRAADYSVISLICLATSAAAGSGAPDCIAMSLVMSPWTLILPAMNACMPACGFWSTKIALAVA